MMRPLFPLLILMVCCLNMAASWSCAPKHQVVAQQSEVADSGSTAPYYIEDDTASIGDSIPADSLESEDGENLLPLTERLRQLMGNDIFERTQVGLYVYNLTADTLVFAHNERQCMRPASNMKLVTSITALHTLGTDYRYSTRFYADTSIVDSTLRGNIYVRGGYDALLDADDLRAFTDSLLSRGIHRIEGAARLDLSFKDKNPWGWGWCWDDDEVQLTPLLFEKHNRFGDALRSAIRKAGIEWDGTVEESNIPGSARLVCQRTHHIDEALLPMMKQSNNCVAESMFYQLAAHGSSQPGTRKSAVRHIENLVKKIGLTPSHYQFADGSGLSLYNYVTPQLLGRLLRFAWHDEAIRRHLLPSLPIAGEDGTLRKRMRGTRAAGNVRAKTGTVEGVSTLSGYCTTSAGDTLCFSIMNQGIRHTSTGRNFQDRICCALVK